MLKNLTNELNKKCITYGTVAKLLSISEKSVYSKIHEKTEFTLKEAKTINNMLFPEYTFSYLFATEQSE